MKRPIYSVLVARLPSWSREVNVKHPIIARTEWSAVFARYVSWSIHPMFLFWSIRTSGERIVRYVSWSIFPVKNTIFFFWLCARNLWFVLFLLICLRSVLFLFNLCKSCSILNHLESHWRTQWSARPVCGRVGSCCKGKSRKPKLTLPKVFTSDRVHFQAKPDPWSLLPTIPIPNLWNYGL